MLLNALEVAVLVLALGTVGAKLGLWPVSVNVRAVRMGDWVVARQGVRNAAWRPQAAPVPTRSFSLGSTRAFERRLCTGSGGKNEHGNHAPRLPQITGALK